MSQSLNIRIQPPTTKFYDRFLREITIGSFVVAAGVRELVVGHIYRLPDLTKQNLSMGVKELKTGRNVNVQFGSHWGVAVDRAKCTQARVLLLHESYLDL